MEKYKELIETLKQGGRLEVPFDFFIECSFHIMEFWDQISETTITPTKVDAKNFDVKYIVINEPYYSYTVSDQLNINNKDPYPALQRKSKKWLISTIEHLRTLSDSKIKLSPEDYARELHRSIKYTRKTYTAGMLDLERLQFFLSRDIKAEFKEITDYGFVLEPYVVFFRGSVGATTSMTRKLKLKGFAKLYEDLADCKPVAYLRDSVKQFDDGKGNIELFTIPHTHINFELWRNESKRFESGHKVAYRLRGEEDYKYLI